MVAGHRLVPCKRCGSPVPGAASELSDRAEVHGGRTGGWRRRCGPPRLPSPQPPCLLPCQRHAEETALLLQSCNAGRTGAAGGGEPRPLRNTRFHPGRKGDSQTLAETRSVLSVPLRQRCGLATGNDETSVPNLGVFCLLVCLRLRRQRARHRSRPAGCPQPHPWSPYLLGFAMRVSRSSSQSKIASGGLSLHVLMFLQRKQETLRF